MLYSAGMNFTQAKFLHMQLIWGALGIIGCMAAAVIDYRTWKKIAVPALICVAILLILVLIPKIGTMKNGARRWLEIGSFRLQPSEAAKLGIILFLAFYADKMKNQMRFIWHGLVIPGSVCAAMAILIFLEPDAGTTALCVALTGILLYLAGARLLYILPPVIVGAVAFGLFLKFDPVRSSRIHAWLNPEETKLGVGMQTYQAKLALGSGGLTGVGLGEGRQKLGFVPEHHTDFIFSVIGEEMGFLATFAVLCAFIAFAICGTYISCHAPDVFGFILGSGITLLISLQALINIGVVTGTLPNKGLSLPFISYGGSNLLMVLTAVGMLFNIAKLAGNTRRARVSNPFADEEVQA